MTHYVKALHELQFVDDGVKKTVTPGTVLPLTKALYDDFTGFNAVIDATDDEIALAKAKSGAGIVETPLETEAERLAAIDKAAADAAKVEAAKSDAKASEKVAAQADANRESAKKPNTVDPLA